MTDVLLIDNFDSFSYNLYQYVGELGADVIVRRNTISIGDICKIGPERIIISPGPGRPEDAGVSVEAIRKFSGKTPILGVCLGHQAIGAAFGAEIKRAEWLFHGKTSIIEHNGEDIFRNIKNPITATRYHSLLVDETTLPEHLKVTARAVGTGTIMGIQHR